MRRAISLFVAGLFVLLFTQTNAMALLSVEARYWTSELNSDIKLTKGGLLGTSVDVKRDLGVDTEQNFTEGRITLSAGKHRVRYAFVPLSWDGRRTLTRTINFAGKTYNINTTVTSSLDVDYHRLSYEYDFVKVPGNRLGIILELKVFDIKSSLQAPGVSSSESVTVGLPALGVGFQVGLPAILSFEGEVTGFTIGSDAYFVDGELGLKITPLPLVSISGGYRYLKLHAESSNDKVDLRLDGPFVMLRIGF